MITNIIKNIKIGGQVLDILTNENTRTILLGIVIIFIFFRNDYSKIKYKSEIHIGLKLLYGAILLFIGFLSIQLGRKYILIILLAPLIVLRTQLGVGIGENAIYYRIYHQRFRKNQEIPWSDIRYPKVYKNDRYTVFEFIDKNGPNKLYFKLEEYKEIKEFVFNKIKEKSSWYQLIVDSFKNIYWF